MYYKNVLLTPPIVIAAPTQRCGTTLMQRALNSTRQVVIYGENSVMAEHLPQLLGHAAQTAKTANHLVVEARNRIVSGLYNQEMTALHPELPSLSSFQNSQFYDLLAFHNQDAISMGFQRWGFKYQPYVFSKFHEFIKLVRTGYYIFLYRDIIDVAASAKSRWGFRDIEHLEKFAQQWVSNTEAMKSIVQNNVHHIEYSDLCSHPMQFLQKITDECKVPSVDYSVFDKKVNISELIDRMSDEERISEYRPPLALTEEELAVIDRICGPTRAKFNFS